MVALWFFGLARQLAPSAHLRKHPASDSPASFERDSQHVLNANQVNRYSSPETKNKRGAEYIASGYACATARVAGMVTSSGPAVENLLPAVLEACMNKSSIILVTTDWAQELQLRSFLRRKWFHR